MQLTAHFADTELGVAGCEARIVNNAVALCGALLEPIRTQFGPVDVDDGYRDPGHNARVGGKSASQHLYIDGNSAADIRTPNDALENVFDWICFGSELNFDQAILEYAGVDGALVRGEMEASESTFYEAVEKFPDARPACIHLSYDGGKQQQRRQGLYGFTGDAVVYVPAEVK